MTTDIGNAKALRWVALAVAVAALTALLVACASAAPSGQQDDDATPTPKPEGIKTPTPTIDPTPTSKPSGDDEEKTTPTPTPTEPLPPTEVPTATPDHRPGPSPTPNPYAHIVIDEEFCFGVSLQDPSLYRARDKYVPGGYIQSECSELVGSVIWERCDPGGGNPFTVDVKACLQRNAETIKDYVIRSSVYPDCFSDDIENDAQFFQCAREGRANDHRLRLSVADVRLAIRAVVDEKQAVIDAERNAWTCLGETADKHPASQHVDTTRLLFWESWTTEAHAQRLSELDETRLEKVREYMQLVDRCALKANVYQTRYDAFMVELRRHMAQGPEQAEPWIKFGILEAMEEYGAEMLRP